MLIGPVSVYARPCSPLDHRYEFTTAAGICAAAACGAIRPAAGRATFVSSAKLVRNGSSVSVSTIPSFVRKRVTRR